MKISVFAAIAALGLAAGCAGEHSAVKHAYPDYPYLKPLTSPGGKFGMLPPAVQNTVRIEAGMADVLDAVRDTHSGRPVYIISFRDAAMNPPLYVAPDGAVLYPDLTVAVPALQGVIVKPESVPPTVIDVVSKKCPAEIASIHKELWGTRVVYLFSFKDEPRNPKLAVAADGMILDDNPQ
ncbi:MAG TPA: hypothetical protein VN578_18150 [Candidatus Binatia bacterium]|jgi:hypothetical protein|nr:hypothetical protein [Candidatus Binatia bacterium]